MTSPKEIQIRDYNYPLPDERIAKFPLPQRDQSKLLISDRGNISERHFADLPDLLPEGSLLVMNNTRVIQARLYFYKETGARVEILVLEPHTPKDYQVNFSTRGEVTWQCMVGGLKKWKQGPLKAEVEIQGEKIEVRAEKRTHPTPPLKGGSKPILQESPLPLREGTGVGLYVTFTWDGPYTWSEVLEAMGELPIPPYLNRKAEESDKRTYQTVYSKIEGSVAAPTAGLHFTPQVLEAIDKKGIEREELTLHVGAGTFRPVKSEDIGGHDMHTEHIAVKRQTIEALIRHNGRAIAVGTTSVRTLESLYWLGRKLQKTFPCKEGGGHQQTSQQLELHVSQWEPYEEVKDEGLRMKDEGLSNSSLFTLHPSPLKALEALRAYMDANDLDVLHASTQIIIVPGYRYRIVERMITNFHQPQSTLLLLVSAFIGDDWHRVYDYALSHDFRFLSYGDSSILIPDMNNTKPDGLPQYGSDDCHSMAEDSAIVWQKVLP
ncbi:MAG: S-adenosylmethionine:tRNA ribosyltransferase-isomerase [Bacteroidaceae bacterium]|nr:S-adenosylmethionine:tRNA ribosyltransferase-isomerase [Bacteroidaceae bacterium]